MQRIVSFEPIPSARAQEHSPSNHAPGQKFEPILDGSGQPELIPDSVAIRALLQTLLIPSNPDAIALKQLQSRIGRASLNDADINILVREIGILDSRVKEQQTRIEAVRPTSSVARSAVINYYIEEQEKLDSLFFDHYQQLLTSLSSDGALKLQKHLLHVKSRIKIYPTPDMSASINEELGRYHEQT